MPRSRPWSRTNRLIIEAAARLGVVAEPLTETETEFFLRLTHCGRSVIISKTRSPFLSQVSQTLSNNKRISRELLGAQGLPVPPDHLVDDDPRSESGAAAFLARHGLVTVKPNWGNRAAGLTVRVEDAATLARAITRAQANDLDEEALIEPYLPGTNLRIAVIGGRALAAAEIRRPWLRGDGRTSAVAMVTELNRDARRADWRAPRLVTLDQIEATGGLAEHLSVYGRGLHEPLPEGFCLEIVSEEIEVIDRTDEVDPGWCSLAARACGLLGVDVGGVDLRGPIECFRDPPGTGPDAWRHSALLEINVLPALHLHALPTKGRARPVFEAFVAYCMSLPGASGPAGVVHGGRLLPA